MKQLLKPSPRALSCALQAVSSGPGVVPSPIKLLVLKGTIALICCAVMVAPSPADQIPTPVLQAALPAKFVHPGMSLNRGDLENLKANLDQEPWKSGFAQLAANTPLDYKMQGPFAVVSRTPDVNLKQYRGDMQMVYNYARMWALTGKATYAQRGHDILLAWATTHTKWDGAESYLTMGDYAYRMYGGADILRGTWPGWTQEDTDTVKNYFAKVYWWGEVRPLRSANQGALELATKVGIAVFNDDQEKFAQCLSAFRGDPNSGLMNSLPNGELGDFGRDQGHGYGQLWTMVWMAEVFYKQGVDVYADQDNRLLAIGENYARYNLGINTPWMPFGTKYDYFWTGQGRNPEGPTRTADLMNVLYDAYTVRKGLSAPYITQYRDERGEDGESFVFRKTVDNSTAIIPPPLPAPAPAAPLVAGLTDAEIGSVAPAGTSSFSEGTWTLRGAGQELWGNVDNCHFSYRQIAGDFTLVAKLTRLEAGDPNAKFGLMMRDSLAPDARRRVYIGFSQRSGVPPLVDIHERGFTFNSHNDPDELTHDGPAEMLPHWFKIERVGSRITIAHSPDGANWTTGQYAEYAGWTDNAYVGFGLVSRVMGKPVTATLTDVRLTGGTGKETAQIPATPFAIYASPGDNQVPLRWLTAYGAAQYRIWRSNRSGGPFTALAKVSGTSYVDKRVVNGTRYFYAVSATNATGESAQSLEDVVVPRPNGPTIQLKGEASASASGAPVAGAPVVGPIAAFDGDLATAWQSGDNSGTSGWLQLDLGAGGARSLANYTLVSGKDNPGRDPHDWQLLGSLDGKSWSQLDVEVGQVFKGRGQRKRYNVAGSTAYRYLRLNITAVADPASNAIELAELILRS